MILSAQSLSHLQSCPRLFLLESDWIVLRIRPKLLFDACLRKGLLDLSNGADAAALAASLKADFLQVAANPGLDLPHGADSYRIAKDWCAMIDTTLRAMAKWQTGKLRVPNPERLNSSSEWQTLAFAGEHGMLHRVITVDRWTEDQFSKELHSWYTFGDICVTSKPMTLHVIEIGQTRGGRRSSGWARGWKHPAMRNTKLKFLHKDGSTFQGWTAVHLADHAELDADEWVEQMVREGATDKLTRHLVVDPPAEPVREDTLSQVLQEAARASRMLTERRSIPWSALPMSRAACDGNVPCPFQQVCHRQGVEIDKLGLYVPKDNGKVAVA